LVATCRFSQANISVVARPVVPCLTHQSFSMTAWSVLTMLPMRIVPNLAQTPSASSSLQYSIIMTPDGATPAWRMRATASASSAGECSGSVSGRSWSASVRRNTGKFGDGRSAARPSFRRNHEARAAGAAGSVMPSSMASSSRQIRNGLMPA
jgi:hypothetical protein